MPKVWGPEQLTDKYQLFVSYATNMFHDYAGKESDLSKAAGSSLDPCKLSSMYRLLNFSPLN